ncbi:MAG: putative baseplate assembly protein [Myxococcales bacterium]|nr:putative baseplate assembly protein [Myxococcales bacterium]
MAAPDPVPAEWVRAVHNRAGQPSLNYRILRYESSRQNMLKRLHRLQLPDGPFAGTRPFAKLSTRQSSDPTLALLDAWALLIDVLSFYQERIANEGFLRTASEELSIVELLRTIGYPLRPSIAASTYVLFDVEDAPGMPRQAFCPKGTQIQSLPEAGELPQTFETLSDLTAHVAWNQLRPLCATPQTLRADSSELVFSQQANGLTLRPGDVVLHPGLGRLFAIVQVRAAQENVGHRVVVRPLLSSSVMIDASLLAQKWPSPSTAVSNVVRDVLQGTYTERELSTLAERYGLALADLPDLVAQGEAERSGDPIVVFQREVPFLGRNAPTYQQLPQGPTGPGGALATLPPYQDASKSWSNPSGQNIRTIWQDCFGDRYVDKNADSDVLLDRSEPLVAPGQLLLIHDNQTGALYRADKSGDRSVLGYGLSTTVTALKLSGPGQPAFLTRESVALLDSRETFLSASSALPEQAVLDQKAVLLDRLVLGLSPGQPLCLSGEPVDTPHATAHELVTLQSVRHKNGHTELTLSPLSRRYVLRTVTLSANVALVNHGETVTEEVLGSGDGSRSHQRFALSRSGLQYQATASERGLASALSIRVNDVEWQERPTLHSAAANELCYTLRTDHAGRTTILFGDGVHGARLPSGQDNIVASYRVGGGPSGEVKAGSLQMLTSPPLGIRTVRNPVAASGSAPAETTQQARQRAPLSTRPLSRLVSRRDYEDFARTFAGIEKAVAQLLHNSAGPLLHVTVAASSGRALPADSLTLQNLRRALRGLGDPTQPLHVQDFHSVRFRVRAILRRSPEFPVHTIEQAARLRFAEAFSFASRELGQAVMAAEVINTLQQVQGVTAVTLLMLHREEEAACLRPALQASPAHLDSDGQPVPSELLLSDASLLTLEVR